MTRKRALTLVCGLAVLGSAAAGSARPRFYMEVRAVREPAGTRPSLTTHARQVFLEELKRKPQVVTDLGDPPPSGPALEKALKARRLTGYGLVLRLTKVDHSVTPPPKGKGYSVLMAEVVVAIDAEKIPSGQMALAGEGTAQVGTEVGKVTDKERVELTHEALTEAVRQAVQKSIDRLGGGGAPKAKPRPTKRAR